MASCIMFNETTINTEFYDRQTRTYGIDSLQYLNNSEIYIVNLDELACEIIKNLTLTGVKNINIIEDDNIFNGKSFYFENNKSKIKSIISYVRDLNPSINVNTFENIQSVNDIVNKSNSIIICTNIHYHSFEYNIIESTNIKAVFAYDTNFGGAVFVDAGENHIVNVPNDTTYEDLKVLRIVDNIVYVENNYLEDDDIIKFTQLQGDCDFLKNKEFIVYNSTKDSFQIDITERVNLINGFVQKIIKPFTISHDKMKDSEGFNESIEEIINYFGEYFYPMISIIGGVASTEVIKLITHKYTPLNQWFEFRDENLKNIIDNNDISELINKYNFLMVGCGALGCEWIKNLSMLGYNQLDVTDPDHIEVSNLSRQFLFRNKDVKMSKSDTAVNYIKNKFPNLNINAFNHKLSQENIDTVIELFNNKDIIINALDNVESRKFIDNMCVKYCIPLFESGTMGMKGNTQPIIPHCTESYNDSIQNDESDEKTFPVCTIKNYPNQIVHTIHWARDYFEIFTRAFENINKYKENPDFYKDLSDFDSNQCIKDINMFCSAEYDDWTDIAYLVKEMFDKEYYKDIKQLLHCYPKEHTINGELFWSNGKRCPKVITDYISTNIINYFEYTTKLLCNCMCIESDFTRKDMIQLMLDFKLPEFEPDTNKNIAKNDSEIKNIQTKDEKLFLDIDNLYIMDKYEPQYFDKDDESNYHIKFITSASNCRAEIYGIDTISEFETKGIAGKIIPAVANTTSTIVGLICLEVIKYILNKEDDNCLSYNSHFLNMSDNTFVQFEPNKILFDNYNGKKFSKWDKIMYKCNKTNDVNKFIIYIENFLGCYPLETICYDSDIIYSKMFDGDIDYNLYKLLENYLKDDKVCLTIIDANDDSIPDVIVNFQPIEEIIIEKYS
jgi:molybdopterin/thiamine biosynthesis adenylyltransferase